MTARTPAERARAYRARRGARPGMFGPPPSAPCGTPSAYRRHLRRGEATCQPCRDAWAASIKARRQSR